MKGEHNQECNITRCDNKEAVYFNHSTRKNYCKSCAEMLNNDEFNKRNAQKLYGHELLTKGEQK